MKLLWDNKAKTATISVNSENPNYPIENLQDTILAKVFRSTQADGVRIKFSTQIKASYVAILNHNIPEGADIWLQGNNTDSWDAPTFSQQLTWNSDIIIDAIDEQTFNYWSLWINHDETGADEYIQIGFVFLGIYLQMPGMDPKQQLPHNTTAKKTISTGGQVYGDDSYEFYNFKVKFPPVTNAQRNSIDTMFGSIKNIIPVIVLIWSNDLDFQPPLYMVIDDKKIPWKKAGSDKDGRLWTFSLNFREVF